MIPAVKPAHKVIVPAIFHEFDGKTLPSWINSTEMLQTYRYSVYLYQKKDASKPRYIAWNRGTEAGVYLRYIVDHYNHFPDIAVFIHGKPEEHNDHWLDAVRCIRPNATYFTLNFAYLSRNTDYWSYFGKGRELWVEQCWREVLKVAWGLESNLTEFHRRLPFDSPIEVNFSCCQQFFLSRQHVHRRSLHDWKRLLQIIGQQEQCKVGEPDYEHLYTYHKYTQQGVSPSDLRKRLGPEPAQIPITQDDQKSQAQTEYSLHGIATQGGAMEHLAHVVYGQQPLHVPLTPTMAEICAQFYPAEQCMGGPFSTFDSKEPIRSPCVP